MKNIFTFLIMVFSVALYAQEEQTEKKDRPVPEPFASGLLIDNQTTFVNNVKSLEFLIQHKFGSIENGSKDVWGVYAPGANIRLGLSYVPYENLQIGYGLTMSDLTHDISLKYTLIEQTRKNTVPVAVALYGNLGISVYPDNNYNEDFEFQHRLSTFYQLIVSRKFTDKLSLQAAASHSHFNLVDTASYDFDRIGVHLNGRYKINENTAITFNYDQPLKLLQLSNNEGTELMPNVAVGVQIATITHVFDIFMGYSKEILPQYYMIKPANEFDFQQFRIGFIIKGLKEF